jgi:dihydrofolate reductase
LKRPEIVLIAALAESNRVIGIEDRLPWHIPEDLKRFKSLTLGHPLVMGRKTFESLLSQFGGPLPNRRHIVLSRNPAGETHPVAEVVPSVGAALEMLADEPVVFIGGGQAVYESTIELADRLELTIVDGQYNGTAFFPEFEHLVGVMFQLQTCEAHPGFRFETYVRLLPQGHFPSVG